MAEASAERRKNSLPGDVAVGGGGKDRPDHAKRVMLGLGASLGSSAGEEHGLRVFVHDRVTVGLRMRTSWERTALDGELGISIWVREPARSWNHLRYDVVSSLGFAASASGGSPYTGLALRVHPRSGWRVLDSLAGEAGARASLDGIEATVTAIVMWPPPRRVPRCFGVGWL